MIGNYRLYQVLLREWSMAPIEHNQCPEFRFKPWCLSTYGLHISSYGMWHFDDPRKEMLFYLRFGDIIYDCSL